MVDWIARFILGVGVETPSRTAWDAMPSWQRRDIFFKHLAQIFGGVAAIVAGLWVVIHFYFAESNDAVVDRQRRLANNQRFGLQIDISATSKREDGCIIIGDIKIKNMGSDTVKTSQNKGPFLEIFRLSSSGGKLKVEAVPRDQIWADWMFDGKMMHFPLTPGLERNLPFYARVDGPGLYDIKYNSDLRENSTSRYIAPAVARVHYSACSK